MGGKRSRSSQQKTSLRKSEKDCLRVEVQTDEAPHNAVKLDMLSIFAGAKCLLSDASLKIAEHGRTFESDTPRGNTTTLKVGTCYGLVGFNGSGKSTLLRSLLDGRLPIPLGWETFLVSQTLPLASSRDALEEVLSVDARLGELLNQQTRLQGELEALAGGCEKKFAQVNSEFLKVQDELAAWDGSREDVETILRALGFDRQDTNAHSCHGPSLRTPINMLSGGWRMKIELAKALWLQPRLLLLDEPTNHLDFRALRWLEDKLQRYSHTVVIVSHDVELLHNICHEILWINDQRVSSLPRSMVSQNDLAQMQRRRELKFQFSLPHGSCKEHHGCSFHDVCFEHAVDATEDAPSSWQLNVSNDIRFSNKSRCVLLGPNGSGKSTFLRLCTGMLTPTHGNIDRDGSCAVAHFSQYTDELDLHGDVPAAVYLTRECPEALEPRQGAQLPSGRSKAKQAVDYEKHLGAARRVLRNYGFEDDMADSILIRNMSGGQKALLKLAVLSLRPAHILFLDEPTNHLDAHACERLANALDEFEGGIVAATHDDMFIYRLIQCNWSVSELLICQEGYVHCQAALGAHCISALKDEVRRSENASASSNYSRGIPPTAMCQASSSKVSTTIHATRSSEQPELSHALQKAMDGEWTDSQEEILETSTSPIGARPNTELKVAQKDATCDRTHDHKKKLEAATCAANSIEELHVSSASHGDMPGDRATDVEERIQTNQQKCR